MNPFYVVAWEYAPAGGPSERRWAVFSEYNSAEEFWKTTHHGQMFPATYADVVNLARQDARADKFWKRL